MSVLNPVAQLFVLLTFFEDWPEVRQDSFVRPLIWSKQIVVQRIFIRRQWMRRAQVQLLPPIRFVGSDLIPKLAISQEAVETWSVTDGWNIFDKTTHLGLCFISMASFSSSGMSKNLIPCSHTRSYKSWSMPVFLIYRNPVLSNASLSLTRNAGLVSSDLPSERSKIGISLNAMLESGPRGKC